MVPASSAREDAFRRYVCDVNHDINDINDDITAASATISRLGTPIHDTMRARRGVMEGCSAQPLEPLRVDTGAEILKVILFGSRTTGLIDAALAIQWIFTGSTPHAQSSRYSLDRRRARNPVNFHWIEAARAIQWIFTGSTPHAQSSGYSLDRGRASNPVDIHWIDAARAIQWIFTGSTPRAQSSGYSLDRRRTRNPVDIHWIDAARAIQWIFTGSRPREQSTIPGRAIQ
jgi:hypothetical protein